MFATMRIARIIWAVCDAYETWFQSMDRYDATGELESSERQELRAAADLRPCGSDG
jgi:hypothetical protein